MIQKNSKLEQAVLFESIDYIYKNINKSIGIFWIAFILFLAMTWGFFELYKIVFIFFLLSAIYLVRYKVTSAYNKDLNASRDVEKWKKSITLISASSGLTLGIIAFFFYPSNQPHYQVAYYIMMISVVSGSASVYEHYEPLYRLTIIPVYLGMMANLAQDISTFTLLMAFALTLFFIFMSKSVKNHYQIYQQLFASQFSNNTLIKHLEKQKKQALKINQEKAYFIASANHDIRQPVHALNLLIDALQKQNLSEQNNSIVLSMKKSLSVLKNYLISMLDMARIESKTIEIQPIPVNLKSMLAEIQFNFNDIALENNIIFKTRAVNTTVNLDHTIMSTVLAHLIHNAFKFSQNKKVLITAKIIQNQIRFQVIDTGKGIKFSDQATVFDDFQQLKDEKPLSKQGLGLGLSISKKMLALLSGSIHVQSIPGKGSCFSVFIPLNQNNRKLSVSTVDPVSVKENLKNKHILVIDNDKMILDAMSCMLSVWECKASLATDYKSAIDALEGTIPDAIISDYRLENGNGIEVIEQLRIYWGKAIKALIITGDISPQMLKKFKDNNVRVYHKPLQAEQLHTLINSLVQ